MTVAMLPQVRGGTFYTEALRREANIVMPDK